MTHRFSSVFPLVGLGLAVVLVAVLGMQNRSLKQRNNKLIERASGPYAGLSMPAFDAVTTEGDSVTIGEIVEGGKQVLFFYTTSCPHSQNTLPAWNQIALEAGEQEEFGVYGIQLDTAQLADEYANANQLRFPVLTLPDRRLRQWYRIGGVPVTVVLGDAGRVLWAKVGEISERHTIDTVLAVVRESALTRMPVASTLGN